jgi:coproporphyrinogen III oxidase-like Fe-S oxidoreductase
MFEELLEQAERAGFHRYEIANFARDFPSVSSPAPSDASGFEPAVTGLASSPALVATQEARGTEDRWMAEYGIELPSHACRHNVNYWRGGSFYGLGPSATTYVRGVREKNWANTALYCERLERGARAVESREELSPLARAGETAAFGLRMAAGWPFEQFRQITGYDLRREWAGDMRQLVEQGWGQIKDDRFYLTREGLRFADAAAQLFLR